EMSQRVAFKLGQALTELHGAQCRHDAIRDRILGILRLGKQGEPGVKPALQALREAFANKVGPDRAGGRPDALDEFNDMVTGRRVTELLADEAYDAQEWVNNIGEPPPDADDHHADDYRGSDDRHDDGSVGQPKSPIYADIVLTRSALHNLPDPEPLIDNVLDQGTVALLYGKWGTLKSFIAYDWAACVATGRPWQGRP